MAEDKALTGGQSLFWLVYGQIAAMLGAFSLLVFLHNFFDLGLKGIIADAFEGWTGYVRPVVGVPLQWLSDRLPEAYRFDVPDVLKDYLAVGLVTATSLMRAVAQVDGWSATREGISEELGFAAGLLLTAVVAWPVALFMGAWYTFDNRQDASAPTIFVLWVTPLIYLGLLFAANAWLV